MTEAKKAWEDVADKLSALGHKLKLHTDAEVHEDGEEFATTLDKLGATVKEVFDGLGSAAKDPAVRDDAKGIASAFADAVDATIDEAKRRVQKSDRD